MPEKSTDDRYIFIHLKESSPMPFMIHEPPTDADLVRAQAGIVRIFRLADMHYFGTEGRWLPLEERPSET
ncbi:hypothetical protein OPIT5_06250 [Opitutaceae bacterium TAV5]|nr:hypothetical protein OPIT5_06250 [Opitutaceae bacterium TAV5]